MKRKLGKWDEARLYSHLAQRFYAKGLPLMKSVRMASAVMRLVEVLCERNRR